MLSVRKNFLTAGKTIFFYIVFFVCLDLMTKSYVQHMEWKIFCNYGFGLGFHLPEAIFFFCWSVVILGLCRWAFLSKHSEFSKYGVILIFSGGMANMIDRLTHVCVRDFIFMGNFPAFNLADIMISVGAGLLLLHFWRK